MPPNEGWRAVTAAKKYEAARPFRRSDRRTGDVVKYAIGDPYLGAIDEPYLLDALGPDGKGPLLRETAAPVPPVTVEAAPASDSESKEEK